jgi:hypothetical protein
MFMVVGCYRFNNNSSVYEPHSKEWIKSKILQGLQRQAA